MEIIGLGLWLGLNENINNKNDEEMQFDSGWISYHIVNIIPSNRNLTDRNTHIGGQLCNIKFDVTTIDNSRCKRERLYWFNSHIIGANTPL